MRRPRASGRRSAAGAPLFMIAGLAGATAQARREAQIARGLGYHAGPAEPGGDEGRERGRADRALPGGGRRACRWSASTCSRRSAASSCRSSFWRRFAAIDNVVAIKMAPFNRYRTLDVIRGVVEAGAEQRVTLYTGNDDHIVLDLRDAVRRAPRRRRRHRAHRGRPARPLERVDAARGGTAAAHPRGARARPRSTTTLLALDSQVTDCNSALFDVAHDFRGCIAGCHEVLRRQGLLEGIWCLDPDEGLSPGQAAELDRVHAAYPHAARRRLRARAPGALARVSAPSPPGFPRLTARTRPDAIVNHPVNCNDSRRKTPCTHAPS